MSDESEEETPSFIRLCKYWWGRIVSPFSEVSDGTKFLVPTVLALISIVVKPPDYPFESFLSLTPELTHPVLLLGVIGVLVVQTWYQIRRFNRVEDELHSMKAENELATDGGSSDTREAFLLYIGGLLIGASAGQAFSPENTLAFALLGGIVAIYFFDSG